MKNTSKKGFTLVEIMIVVVIIGLLAAMAIPAFNKVRSNAREKAIINNLRQVASAAQQYLLESGAESVTYADLVPTYFADIEVVAGEDYTAITITNASVGSANFITASAANDDTVGNAGIVTYTL